MDALIAWLRAQFDEDERVALAASGDPWVVGVTEGYPYSHPGDVYAVAPGGTAARIAQGTRCGPDISAEQTSAHIARHDPARVLREVEARRWMLAEIVSELADDATQQMVNDRLRMLAAPYADEPGYLDEWRAESVALDPDV